jgi:hypothetical protein
MDDGAFISPLLLWKEELSSSCSIKPSTIVQLRATAILTKEERKKVENAFWTPTFRFAEDEIHRSRPMLRFYLLPVSQDHI